MAENPTDQAPAATERYLVPSWGAGHFRIDDEGFLRVQPDPEGDESVRLQDVIEELRRRGLRSPFVVRFPQILGHRVERLHEAFRKAIEEFSYPERYQGVYPIKVNQQREVVEGLVAKSGEHRYGLEVGSKGELVLALTQSIDPEALLVCNGFKDDDYIELALRARGAGIQTVVICETLAEVHQTIGIGREVGVKPAIGVRARLHTSGAGKWVESGGSHAKFGLSALELVQCMDFLEREDALDTMDCMHFHIGSQISDILSIKEAVKEAARIWCHLKKRCSELTHLDMGGGLGVDYDGSSTSSDWSLNYDVEEYSRDCVYNVMAVCEEEGVNPPRLVSESGRAVTAHSSMVAMKPLKVIGRTKRDPVPALPHEPMRQVEDLLVTLREMSADNWRESVNEARSLHDEVLAGFKLGFVDLENRAVAEAVLIDISRRALELLDVSDEDEEEVRELMTTAAPMLICNFSVFQSIPDTWAVRQVFPIMPLSQLEGEDTVPMTLGDITCDSDGRVDDFVNESGTTSSTLLLPPIDMNDPYLLGIFLTGAYQDTLGDYHNLFGAANEAAIRITGDGRFEVSRITRATAVSDTLKPFGFERKDVVSLFEDRFGGLDDTSSIRFRDAFLRVLSSGTYLRR